MGSVTPEEYFHRRLSHVFAGEASPEEWAHTGRPPPRYRRPRIKVGRVTSAKIDVAAVVRSARRRLADPSRQTAVVLTKSDGDLYVSLSLEDFVRMIGDWWTIVHRPTTYDLPPPPSVLDGIEDPDGEDRGPPEMRTVALPEAAPARRRQRPDASADV